MKLRIVAHNWEPISILKSGSNELSGVMGKLVDAILSKRNISYTILRSNDNFGTPLPNGSWNGMSGYLHRNEADIMLGPPLMSYDRFKIMDFSTPLMFDSYRILSHNMASSYSNLLRYFGCFDSIIWSLIIVSFSISILIYILTDRLVSETNQFESNSDYFIIFVQILFIKNSTILFNSGIKRFICCNLMTAVYILSISLNAMIGVNLVVTRRMFVIDSLEDLVKMETCIPVSFKGTIAGHTFKSAAVSDDRNTNIYERIIGQKMIQIEENESFFGENLDKLLNNRYVYVTAEVRILLIAMNICRERSEADLYLGNQKTHSTPRSLGLSKHTLDFDIKKYINSDISLLHASGIYGLWMEKAINATQLKCITNFDQNNTPKIDLNGFSITVHLLNTFFLLILILYCFSVFIFLLEKAMHVYGIGYK